MQVGLGPQDGTFLVTLLPVPINSQSGTSNGLPVTVNAERRKVTEVDSPTGDPIISFIGLQAMHGRVRIKSRENQSDDSVLHSGVHHLIKNRG